MEYGHEQAVADGVNVDYDVYRIRTRITEGVSGALDWVREVNFGPIPRGAALARPILRARPT